MENRDTTAIQYLIKTFYSGCLHFSLNTEDIEQLTWDRQQVFLEATVMSKVFKKYPVNNEYCKLFFKKLIALLETSQQEVHDELYSFLCAVMKSRHNEDFCYRHYIIGNSLCNLITIKETNRIVVNGTTGMRTWEAALILSDWILCNKNQVNNKHILELGSGVGFTGITVVKFCDIKSMTMTDCHNNVLKTLCDNIYINFPNVLREDNNIGTEYIDRSKILRVRTLDWNNIEDIHESFVPTPDIVLGTDIVYDPEIIKPLCNVIKLFLERNKETKVFLASIIRNENTFKQFLEELSNMHLQWEHVTQTKGVFIHFNNVDTNGIIVKITFKS